MTDQILHQSQPLSQPLLRISQGAQCDLLRGYDQCERIPRPLENALRLLEADYLEDWEFEIPHTTREFLMILGRAPARRSIRQDGQANQRLLHPVIHAVMIDPHSLCEVFITLRL